jgi:putative restriction endonuclease
LKQFLSHPHQKTLVLGWSEDFETFAGFDYRRHSGVIGAFPSMQISRDSLTDARQLGFAPTLKGNGETAIAFRADFAATYVEHLWALHDTGAVSKEANILAKISANPESVADREIEAVVAPQRRMELVATRRAARDAQFRRRVLNAYGHRCAMCGSQLRLLDAAHVLPVDQPGSTDDTDNGVALCALHHRAYDRALVAFNPNYELHVSAGQVAELSALSLNGGLQQFQAALKSTLLLPPDPRDYPKSHFIIAANKVRGWRA